MNHNLPFTSVFSEQSGPQNPFTVNLFSRQSLSSAQLSSNLFSSLSSTNTSFLAQSSFPSNPSAHTSLEEQRILDYKLMKNSVTFGRFQEPQRSLNPQLSDCMVFTNSNTEMRPFSVEELRKQDYQIVLKKLKKTPLAPVPNSPTISFSIANNDLNMNTIQIPRGYYDLNEILRKKGEECRSQQSAGRVDLLNLSFNLNISNNPTSSPFVTSNRAQIQKREEQIPGFDDNSNQDGFLLSGVTNRFKFAGGIFARKDQLP